MVDFLFFFPNPNKIVALIIKRKHSIRVIGTAYRNRADSIIFENGKARYITPAGEIGRSIFVYNPATKAWNSFDKEGNRVTGVSILMKISITSRKMVAKLKVKLSKKMASSITMSQAQVFLLADATSK